MIKQLLHNKIGSALAVVASIGLVGSIATVSAAQHGQGAKADLAASTHLTGYGYDKDQCKDGGWMNFTDPNGDPMFKNQGQCIAFFVSSGAHSSSADTTNTSNVDVSITNNQSAVSGDAEEKSGDAIVSGDTSVNITSSPGAGQ